MIISFKACVSTAARFSYPQIRWNHPQEKEAASRHEKSPETLMFQGFFRGAPWGIRTLDLLIRSQTLYPAELRAQALLTEAAYVV